MAYCLSFDVHQLDTDRIHSHLAPSEIDLMDADGGMFYE